MNEASKMVRQGLNLAGKNEWSIAMSAMGLREKGVRQISCFVDPNLRSLVLELFLTPPYLYQHKQLTLLV